MKRVPLLLVGAGTVAGFAGVFGFHTGPTGMVISGTPASAGNSAYPGHELRQYPGHHAGRSFGGGSHPQCRGRGGAVRLRRARREGHGQRNPHHRCLGSGPAGHRPHVPADLRPGFPHAPLGSALGAERHHRRGLRAPPTPARPTPSPCSRRSTSCTSSDGGAYPGPARRRGRGLALARVPRQRVARTAASKPAQARITAAAPAGQAQARPGRAAPSWRLTPAWVRDRSGAGRSDGEPGVTGRGTAQDSVCSTAPSRPATTAAKSRPPGEAVIDSSSPSSKYPGPIGDGVSGASPARATASPSPPRRRSAES